MEQDENRLEMAATIGHRFLKIENSQKKNESEETDDTTSQETKPIGEEYVVDILNDDLIETVKTRLLGKFRVILIDN